MVPRRRIARGRRYPGHDRGRGRARQVLRHTTGRTGSRLPVANGLGQEPAGVHRPAGCADPAAAGTGPARRAVCRAAPGGLPITVAGSGRTGRHRLGATRLVGGGAPPLPGVDPSGDGGPARRPPAHAAGHPRGDHRGPGCRGGSVPFQRRGPAHHRELQRRGIPGTGTTADGATVCLGGVQRAALGGSSDVGHRAPPMPARYGQSGGAPWDRKPACRAHYCVHGTRGRLRTLRR